MIDRAKLVSLANLASSELRSRHFATGMPVAVPLTDVKIGRKLATIQREPLR